MEAVHLLRILPNSTQLLHSINNSIANTKPFVANLFHDHLLFNIFFHVTKRSNISLKKKSHHSFQLLAVLNCLLAISINVNSHISNLNFKVPSISDPFAIQTNGVYYQDAHFSQQAQLAQNDDGVPSQCLLSTKNTWISFESRENEGRTFSSKDTCPSIQTILVRIANMQSNQQTFAE